MDAIVELFLFTVICASVGGVQSVCIHVKNDDMVEFSCEGGQLSDLYDLPESTGKIRITDMPVSRITTNTFSRFGSDLWVLSCSHCEIRDIEPGAFQRLTNLQQLSLDNNHLSTVKESWFRGLDYLTYLDLNYNNIETIEDGVYENLPSLIDLRLSGNRLECLNLNALANLRDLKRMFLGENSEFKCPNAVSTFLESRGVIFDRDPEWDRIPNDLIPIDEPYDYEDVDEDERTASNQPMSPLPIHRERLHPTSVTPSPPFMESTPSYVPPKFHTTEEVIYRPLYTPNWRTTTSIPTTVPYDDREEFSASSPYHQDVIRPYVPPKTITPIDAYETMQYNNNNEDATTSRSWPTFSESTSAKPEYPPYPLHGNEDKRFEEEYYSSEATNTFPLAPSPPDHRVTTSFVESDVEYTTVPYWIERSTAPSDSPIDNRPPEYRVPLTHVVQPLPPVSPEIVHPASPDNTFQPPYYEHAVTVHSPPFEGNQPSLEEVTPKVVLIETTTDKPLPNCPTSNISSSSRSSIGTILVSVLLVTIGRVIVKGF